MYEKRQKPQFSMREPFAPSGDSAGEVDVELWHPEFLASDL
jgi:hypothetical protein